MGKPGLRVQELLCQKLGLGVPPISWHTARDGVAEVATVLGLLVGTLGKIAQEVALLQKTETAELEEGYQPGRGGSSTMPQKRNPIACEAIIGIAKIVRQDVALALDVMAPDHERATGPWHAEWEVVPELFVLSHGALSHSIGLLENLVIRPDRMARNLAFSEGLIASEAVMMRLSPLLGRQEAHDVVYDACMEAFEHDRSLRELLLQVPRVAAALPPAELDELLDPRNYTGLATDFVDRVLTLVYAGLVVNVGCLAVRSAILLGYSRPSRVRQPLDELVEGAGDPPLQLKQVAPTRAIRGQWKLSHPAELAVALLDQLPGAHLAQLDEGVQQKVA